MCACGAYISQDEHPKADSPSLQLPKHSRARHPSSPTANNKNKAHAPGMRTDSPACRPSPFGPRSRARQRHSLRRWGAAASSSCAAPCPGSRPHAWPCAARSCERRKKVRRRSSMNAPSRRSDRRANMIPSTIHPTLPRRSQPPHTTRTSFEAASPPKTFPATVRTAATALSFLPIARSPLATASARASAWAFSSGGRRRQDRPRCQSPSCQGGSWL